VVVGAVANDQENDIGSVVPVGDDEASGSDDDNTRSFRKSVKRLRKKIVSWSGNENELNVNAKNKNNNSNNNKSASSASSSSVSSRATMAIVDETFGPLEDSLQELEDSLVTARAALSRAKLQSFQAMEAMEAVSSSSTTTTTTTTSDETNDDTAAFDDIYTNLDALTFEDIDYESSEMAPPFLDQDSCLMTDAEPLVRVEKAPDNSRRIFAGIDILASTEDVWKVRHRVVILIAQLFCF
jgi:hypothetical protein